MAREMLNNRIDKIRLLKYLIAYTFMLIFIGLITNSTALAQWPPYIGGYPFSGYGWNMPYNYGWNQTSYSGYHGNPYNPNDPFYGTIPPPSGPSVPSEIMNMMLSFDLDITQKGYELSIPYFQAAVMSDWTPYHPLPTTLSFPNGIFGSPYVTAPPPDLSGWTWTSPTTATSPPLPDGTSAAVAVDFVAGYEGLSPYYQQNDGLGSPLGISPSIYDQYYGWNQPYYGYSWNQPYNYYNYGEVNIYPNVYQDTFFGAFQYSPVGFIYLPTDSFGFPMIPPGGIPGITRPLIPIDAQNSYDPLTGLFVWQEST